jgi:hypothetical protein
MNRKTFRGLILLYLALGLAASVASFLPGGYSQALTEAFENEPTPAVMDNPWVMLGLVLPFLLAVAAGLYGLYMFKRWGRALSAYTTGLGLVVFGFSGPSLYGGVEYALFEASALLWGAILALSYYSSVSAEFGVAPPAGENAALE